MNYRILIDGKETKTFDSRESAFSWFELLVKNAVYNESDETIQIFLGDDDEPIESFNFFDEKQMEYDEWMDSRASEHYYQLKYGDT